MLNAAAEDLDTAMRRIRLLVYAILDGTLFPIDRVADQLLTPSNPDATRRNMSRS